MRYLLNLFFAIDLSILHFLNSLVMKGASLALTAFFFRGAWESRTLAKMSEKEL